MPSIGCQYTVVRAMNGTSWQSGRSSIMSTRTTFAGLYKCRAFCELYILLLSLSHSVSICEMPLLYGVECIVKTDMIEMTKKVYDG